MRKTSILSFLLMTTILAGVLAQDAKPQKQYFGGTIKSVENDKLVVDTKRKGTMTMEIPADASARCTYSADLGMIEDGMEVSLRGDWSDDKSSYKAKSVTIRVEKKNTQKDMSGGWGIIAAASVKDGKFYVKSGGKELEVITDDNTKVEAQRPISTKLLKAGQEVNGTALGSGDDLKLDKIDVHEDVKEDAAE